MTNSGDVKKITMTINLLLPHINGKLNEPSHTYIHAQNNYIE